MDPLGNSRQGDQERGLVKSLRPSQETSRARRRLAFASAASASSALLTLGLWSRRGVPWPRSRSIVTNVAVGADGVLGSLAHPDHARASSTFATVGDVYAERTQSRLRAPQAASEGPRIFGPVRARPRGAVSGKFNLSTQEICSASRPGAALGHDLAHASGHRIGIDHILDGRPAVSDIGTAECAGGPEGTFTSCSPNGEVGHPRQAIEADLRQRSQTVACCVEQRPQKARTG
jgi:hypothetical protein